MCDYLREHLAKQDVLDRPNERSMHTTPVPRGGGWAIWAATLPLWLIALFVNHDFRQMLPLLSGTLILVLISWWDDRKSLSATIRLSIHILAVVFGLGVLDRDQMIFQGFFPFWLDRLVAGFGWLWFINLTNFMDGIDGISGAESAHLSLGFLIICLLTSLPLHSDMALAVCLLGAFAGFLYWNWSPAKIFLGDVGSIPAGYLLGYFMIKLAATGHLAIALALPLYYVADASITLIRRIKEKKNIGQAHREHFYQKAALALQSHSKTVILIAATNAGLLILCAISLKTGAWLLIAAPLLVGGLLWYLNRVAQR